MRTCVHVACAPLLAITAVRVQCVDYAWGGCMCRAGCSCSWSTCAVLHVVESACHVQCDMDTLAPSEHLVAVEPLAKCAVLGELKHHGCQYV